MDKMTGNEWAGVLGITILDPTGWFSKEDYLNIKIRKFEFLNRASQSKVLVDQNQTRRSASSFRNKINNNINAK